MADPRSIDSPGSDADPPDLDRDAKIDELLLAGLEQYFGGGYQEAINIWGRVLFLDRGHQRARAYIERARGALAERQRTTDELVQEGVAALDRGDGPAARRLLATAVATGEPHDLAHTYLDRLDRLLPPRERERPPLGDGAERAEQTGRRRLSGPARPVRTLPIIGAAILVGVVILYAASRDLLRPLVAREWRQVPAAGAAVTPDPLPAPRPSEVALGRARDLYRSGHLKAALAALDGVSEADPLAPDAVRLTVELQRILLESASAGTQAGSGSAARLARPRTCRGAPVKCPKCGYLGFDSGDRCKNCGYDFSLVSRSRPGIPAARSSTRPRSPVPAVVAGTGERGRRPVPGLAARRDAGRSAAVRRRPPGAAAAARAARGAPGHADACARPSPNADARSPARSRSSASEPGEVRNDIEADTPQASDTRAGQAVWPAATAGRRAAAAAIDLSLVALIDVVVLHFTLALCGLTFNDLHVLPVLPMAAFLLVLNGGYVVLFTGTLGQTFGKMATAIEVVSDRREQMDLRRAALRGAAMVVSLLPAGLGWLAGLVGDHRGLHDRLAGTRVVRVPGV